MALVETPWITLSLDEISNSDLQPFRKYDLTKSQSGLARSLFFHNVQIRNEELKVLLGLELESLDFGSVSLDVDWEQFAQNDIGAKSTKYLRLGFGETDMGDWIQLVRVVKPKWMSLYRSTPITSDILRALVEVESLEEIQYFDDTERVWVTIKRPFAELDSVMDGVEP